MRYEEAVDTGMVCDRCGGPLLEEEPNCWLFHSYEECIRWLAIRDREVPSAGPEPERTKDGSPLCWCRRYFGRGDFFPFTYLGVIHDTTTCVVERVAPAVESTDALQSGSHLSQTAAVDAGAACQHLHVREADAPGGGWYCLDCGGDATSDVTGVHDVPVDDYERFKTIRERVAKDLPFILDRAENDAYMRRENLRMAKEAIAQRDEARRELDDPRPAPGGSADALREQVAALQAENASLRVAARVANEKREQVLMHTTPHDGSCRCDACLTGPFKGPAPSASDDALRKELEGVKRHQTKLSELASKFQRERDKSHKASSRYLLALRRIADFCNHQETPTSEDWTCSEDARHHCGPCQAKGALAAYASDDSNGDTA